MQWLRSSATRQDFERFVAERTGPLLRTAFLVPGDAAEAEDLVQETLFRVARRWPRVAAMESPGAYARKILLNLALRDSRRRSRRRAELARRSRFGARRQPSRRRPAHGGSPGRADRRAEHTACSATRCDRAALLGRPAGSRGRRDARLLCRHGQEHRVPCPRPPPQRQGRPRKSRTTRERQMTQHDTIEPEVRAALAGQAAQVPADAAARLGRRD